MKSPRSRYVSLSEPASHQLDMYALCAIAAGVGGLTLAPSAEAKIVYTPRHVVIGPNQYFGIDFNHDGISDVIIINSWFRYYGASVDIVRAFPNQTEGAGIEEVWPHTSWPSQRLERALKGGVRVGHGPRFYQKGVMAGLCIHGTNDGYGPCSYRQSNSAGRWVNVRNRYLGVSFAFKSFGKTHYGWARLNVEQSRKPFKAAAILTGYAYETIPNKAIITGKTKGPDVVTVQPATLGELALGRK